MEQYQIDVNDSRVYPMGLTQTDGGIHVSVVAAAKACSRLLFEQQEGKNGKAASVCTNPSPVSVENIEW